MHDGMLNIGSDMREPASHGTPDFPVALYTVQFANYMDRRVPWHWHADTELFGVLSGTLVVRVSDKRYELRAGDGMFINANALHSMHAAIEESCVVVSFVFNPSLIAGAPDSIFDREYVRPLIEKSAIDSIVFHANVQWHSDIVKSLVSLKEVFEEAKFGYELLVRSELSHIWGIIVSKVEYAVKPERQVKSADEERIKQMLTFIRHNCASKLTTADIAASASISERECYRCFQSMLDMTPFTYLTRVRIRLAAKMLVETDMSVTDISFAVGFTDTSYFSKTFRTMMKCTPREYRTRKREGAK